MTLGKVFRMKQASPEEVAKEQEARQQAEINQQTATEAVSAGVNSQLKGQQ